MPEKVGFWIGLRENKIKQSAFLFVCMSALILLYILCLLYVKEIKVRRAVEGKDYDINYDLVQEITGITFNEDNYEVTGGIWIKNNKIEKVDLILQKNNGDEYIKSKTKVSVENKLKNAKDAYYENVNFVSVIEKEDIDENACYEVLLYVSYDESHDVEGNIQSSTLIPTGEYWYKGELYPYNPENFVAPQIKGDYIEQVILCGNVCAYSEEIGYWVYEYAGKLYWIVSQGDFVTAEYSWAIPRYMYVFDDSNMSDELRDVYEKEGYLYSNTYLTKADSVHYERESYYIVEDILLKECPMSYIKTGLWGRELGWVYQTTFQVFDIK